MSTQTASPRRLRIFDMGALIVGYGTAAVLVKSFWPEGGLPNRASGVILALVYLWLGMAMGGPLVLLLDRRAAPPSDPAHPVSRYTWAETAWLMIGAYWIGLALFIVPARLRENPLLGVLPVVLAVGLRLFRKSRPTSKDTPPGWTHHAAIGLLFTWPLAWIGMILLGKAFM